MPTKNIHFTLIEGEDANSSPAYILTKDGEVAKTWAKGNWTLPQVRMGAEVFINNYRETYRDVNATFEEATLPALSGEMIIVTKGSLKVGDRVKLNTHDKPLKVTAIEPDGCYVQLMDSEGYPHKYSYPTLFDRDAMFCREPDANTEEARWAENDLRYAQVRDKLESLGFARVSSHTSADNPHNEISQYHTYAGAGDGSKRIVMVRTNRNFKIVALDVYREVSDSINWADYIASVC